MLNTIESINSVVNNFIWGVPAMICIIGVGLILSFRTGFIQIRKFPYAMKATIGRMFKKKTASDGSITPFQAVCTALAATVGTGNIAGVVSVTAEINPAAVAKRHEQGWVDEVFTDLPALLKRVNEAREAGEAVSFAYQGNIVDLWEFLADKGVQVDLGSDQTSLHNPYAGGY